MKSNITKALEKNIKFTFLLFKLSFATGNTDNFSTRSFYSIFFPQVYTKNQQTWSVD